MNYRLIGWTEVANVFKALEVFNLELGILRNSMKFASRNV